MTTLHRSVVLRVGLEDLALASEIAGERTAGKSLDQDCLQSNSVTYHQATFYGALGEVIFQRETGLLIDRTIYDRGDRCDFTTAIGARISVKTRLWSGSNLQMFLFPREVEHADYFFLFRLFGQTDRIACEGWISSNKIRENFRPRRQKHIKGEKIVVPSYELMLASPALLRLREQSGLDAELNEV